jgi:polyisoprenoid-binding protein YceI
MLPASGFFLLMVLCASFIVKKGKGNYFIVDAKSNISIEGKANVVDYGCAITTHNWGDTIFVEKFSDSLCRFSKNKLNIPVLSFNCDNSVMTEDFKETLNAKEFPTINLGVDELIFKCGRLNTTLLKGKLTIAGNTKPIKLYCQQSNKGDELIITGAKKLTFSEFNLVPPEKFFGMVKVEDEITIFFDLHLR